VSANLTIGREICGELGQALRREWLVTNGLGGFAAGTVAGCQTRRYHGLLIAATAPPGGRVLFLVDLDAIVQIGARDYELACHEYGGEMTTSPPMNSLQCMWLRKAAESKRMR